MLTSDVWGVVSVETELHPFFEQMVRKNDFKVKQLESQRSSRILNAHSWFLEMLLHRLRAIKSKEEDQLASILGAVGEFGTFQRRLVALTFIPNILSAFFTFADSLVFTAQKAYCNTSWILAMYPNLSEAEQLNLTLPRESNGSFLTCLMYSPVDWNLDSIIQFGLNHTEMCRDGWIYPESKKRLLTDEFDLVCGKEFDWELVMTVYMAGFLIGSVTFGFLCDRLGRYPTILLSLLGLIVFGFGTAFVNSMEVYLFFRFSVSQAAFSARGVWSGRRWFTEWLVGEHRARATVLSHCYFTAGTLLLSGLAYSLPHWRLLFLVGGAPVFAVIPYIWILPESPRWLMVRGKTEEAKQLLCRAASVNKKVVPLNLLDKMHLSGKKTNKTPVLAFFSNRHLRKVVVVMGCLWFSVGYTYLTLSFKMKDFGVSPYARQMIPSLLEVPARLCCILLLEHLGRKWTLAMTLLQSSLVCLLVLLLPRGRAPPTPPRRGDGPRLRWPCWLATGLKFTVFLVILLGEFSLAGSVTLLLIYTAELLPTVLRATGLGLVSLAFAAGAISSLRISLISQTPSILPASLSCALALLASYLCFLLPETQNQPLADRIKHMSSQLSLQKKMSQEDPLETLTEDTSSEDVSEEAAKNAVLNTMVQKVDSDILVTMPQQPRKRADRQDP
ncbi:solute carrier family 22 member 14 [Trichechus manatus latirostris]|uniref:Solute carrier family 22 member 14 n=1 Tax=Trichechus manatus latirostris TaxID=127582 RepID=A0A2Y9R859_TRIMA|nr:solute carrier family 22 member 14 [Trichechus manatus latirostris]